MNPSTQASLDKAREYFYSGRLIDAYNILKRYYDRLPFQPETAHGEHIGMFVRVLVELGKDNEIKFYFAEIERQYDKLKSPAITYQMAVLYGYLPEPRWERYKNLLESLIRNAEAKEFHAKAKMMLADYYDRVHKDTASCRRLIDSIPKQEDPIVAALVDIWRAKVFRDEKRLDEAGAILERMCAHLDSQTNWYVYFCTKIGLASLRVFQGAPDKALEILAEIRQRFAGRNFKSVQLQIATVEEVLEKTTSGGPLQLKTEASRTTLIYKNRSVQLTDTSPTDKLLLLLVEKRSLDKAIIVRNLYARDYENKRDDKLIYYHVHNARKKLRDLGLTTEAIVHDATGYRLATEIEPIGRDHET